MSIFEIREFVDENGTLVKGEIINMEEEMRQVVSKVAAMRTDGNVDDSRDECRQMESMSEDLEAETDTESISHRIKRSDVNNVEISLEKLQKLSSEYLNPKEVPLNVRLMYRQV